MAVKLPLLLCWSGGLDSTMVLLKYLRDGVKEIYTFYIELTNNIEKSKMEVRARAKIRRELEKEFGVSIIDTHIHVGNISLPFSSSLTIQPLLWALGTIVRLSDKRISFETISYGYIREDDFWHFRKDFESIIHSGLYFIDLNFMKDVVFDYPLEWHTKQEVWDMYGEGHKHIRDLTWTCENPQQDEVYDIITCGTCKPCEVKKKLVLIKPVLSDSVIDSCVKLVDSVKEVFPSIGINQASSGG